MRSISPWPSCSPRRIRSRKLQELLEVGSWADVSNKDHGVTWVTLDAPLVEVGGITATLLGGQSHPEVWRKHIEPTQSSIPGLSITIWETNYRAYQDGIITSLCIAAAQGL